MDKAYINLLYLQFKYKHIFDVVLCLIGIYCTSIHPKEQGHLSRGSPSSFIFFPERVFSGV